MAHSRLTNSYMSKNGKIFDVDMESEWTDNFKKLEETFLLYLSLIPNLFFLMLK